jgi:tetratricopeptide (TPR) repeat protein
MAPHVLLVFVLAAADRNAADRRYSEGQYGAAAEQYRQLLKANPRDPALLIRLADCVRQLGQLQEAQKDLEAALEAAPDSLAALVTLTEVFLAEGRAQDAMQSSSRALRLNPADRDVRRVVAHTSLVTRRFFQAESILKELTASDPSDAKSWYLLGELMYRGGYYRAAEEALEKCLAVEPANRRAEIFRAVCLVKCGRLPEGEAACKRLIANADTPKDLDLWLTYAEVLYDSDRTEEALRIASQATGFAPADPVARYWLAKCLLQAGKLPEATIEAERAVAAAPQLPFPRTLLLQIYRIQGRTADAARQAEWLRDYDDHRARRTSP